MTDHVRILLGFNSMTDQQVGTTGVTVIKGLTGNKSFTTLPVDLAAVQTEVDDLNAAVAAQAQGGPAATVTKNNKRKVLNGLLRKLAHYVQANCGDDLEVLLSSGFQALTVKVTRSPLDKPTIIGVDNGHTTQLVVKIGKVARAKAYEVRTAPIGADNALGPWQDGGTFTNSRSMAVGSLTPGTIYAVQTRAVGGSTGYSDWSDGVSHMCM
jgi:hypothetical protein